jgi:hypothetical protein
MTLVITKDEAVALWKGIGYSSVEEWSKRQMVRKMEELAEEDGPLEDAEIDEDVVEDEDEQDRLSKLLRDVKASGGDFVLVRDEEAKKAKQAELQDDDDEDEDEDTESEDEDEDDDSGDDDFDDIVDDKDDDEDEDDEPEDDDFDDKDDEPEEDEDDEPEDDEDETDQSEEEDDDWDDDEKEVVEDDEDESITAEKDDPLAEFGGDVHKLAKAADKQNIAACDELQRRAEACGIDHTKYGSYKKLAIAIDGGEEPEPEEVKKPRRGRPPKKDKKDSSKQEKEKQDENKRKEEEKKEREKQRKQIEREERAVERKRKEARLKKKQGPPIEGEPEGINSIRNRFFAAGTVLARRGLEEGISIDMIKAVDDEFKSYGVGRSNARATQSQLVMAWHVINGYLNGNPKKEKS